MLHRLTGPYVGVFEIRPSSIRRRRYFHCDLILEFYYADKIFQFFLYFNISYLALPCAACYYLSIYLSFYLSMDLRPFVGPWLFYQILDLLNSR
jgi:hypothetical protein